MLLTEHTRGMPAAVAGGGPEVADSAEPTSCLPFVSVIVPVFDDAAALAMLLRALARQDYAAERFECVIVDNGSPEPLRVQQALPFAVRVVREPSPGSYAARNRGISQARGSILAFTDADCVPRSDWLSSAVANLQQARGPAVVAGQITVTRHGARADSAWQWHSAINDLNQRRFVNEYHFAATANLIANRIVFDQVGVFDATLFSGGDWEWGRRAWSAGVAILFAEDVVVEHPARANWESLVAKARRVTGGHFAILRRRARPLVATLILLAKITRASLARTWAEVQIPTWRRFQIMSVDLMLRFSQLGEIVRLALGGLARRR